MCFLSITNYSNILRIKIKSVYVKDFLISTKVRLKRGEHLHGEEPISSEPTFWSATVRPPSEILYLGCYQKTYKPIKISQNWSKLVETGQNWSKLVETG